MKEWELIFKGQSRDISDYQYVIVHIKMDTILQDFKSIKDDQIKVVLKKNYGLEALYSLREQSINASKLDNSMVSEDSDLLETPIDDQIR